MSEQPRYGAFAEYQESAGSVSVTEEAVRAFITGKAGEDPDKISFVHVMRRRIINPGDLSPLRTGRPS